MKKFFAHSTLFIVALFAMTVVPAFAESGHMDFTAPFAFTVGGVELPAGAYQITTRSDGAIFVTSPGTQNAATAILFHAESNDSIDKASVQFVRRGNKLVLNTVDLSSGQVFKAAAQH